MRVSTIKLLSPIEEYARFTEDARLGWLELANTRPTRSAKFDRNLSLPVFNFGYEGLVFEGDAVRDAMASVADGSLRLPFPECVFMYEFPADYFASLQSYGTIWICVMQQTEREIVGNLFYRHPNSKMQHYGVNSYQFIVTLDGLEVAHDPCMPLHPNKETETIVEQSAKQRALGCITHSHLLSTRPGLVTATVEPETEMVRKVNERRTRMMLDTLMRFRTIRLGADNRPMRPASRVAEPLSPNDRGAVEPHWRRGHWRTYQSGRSVWVRSCSVHGGDGSPPPWYEVR